MKKLLAYIRFEFLALAILACFIPAELIRAQSRNSQVSNGDSSNNASNEDSGIVNQLGSARNDIQELQLKLTHLEEMLDRFNEVARQTQAQATCRALAPTHWSFAVERSCPGDRTCREICSSLSESQAGKLSCINSLHVYADAPSSTAESLGLKTYRYNDCNARSCGPNFCCCAGTGS